MHDAKALSLSLMPAVRLIAREAGAIALKDFRSGERTAARVWSKAGGSPVTEADVAVDAFLKVRLSALLPEAAWLSEETRDDLGRLGRPLVWIVDPIDGTRAYLSGDADWSVAIALLTDGIPTLGIVHAPARDAFYEAVAGRGATRDGAPIRVAGTEALAGARATGPKPLLDHVERRGAPLDRVGKVPSLALRLARVAEGTVDVGLVSSDARDWDIAAADLILSEAGGLLTGFDGRRPPYNQREPVHGELVAAPRRLHPHVIDAMRTARGASTPPPPSP
jgi:myo-inositol-1(or 4)-monophosphatase